MDFSQTDLCTVSETLSLSMKTHLSHSPTTFHGLKGRIRRQRKTIRFYSMFDYRISRTAVLKQPVDLVSKETLNLLKYILLCRNQRQNVKYSH